MDFLFSSILCEAASLLRTKPPIKASRTVSLALSFFPASLDESSLDYWYFITDIHISSDLCYNCLLDGLTP